MWPHSLLVASLRLCEDRVGENACLVDDRHRHIDNVFRGTGRISFLGRGGLQYIFSCLMHA